MTDMTTITTPATAAQPKTSKPGSDAAAPTAKPNVVTLEQLSKELKVSPRDARMLLRLASKQTKQYPHLGKDHVARQPWQWTIGSKSLEEARTALAASKE
jgi:hypothetical protein